MVDCFNKNIDKLKLKKLWLFDMDGTIYLENSLFKKVKNLLTESIDSLSTQVSYISLDNTILQPVNEIFNFDISAFKSFDSWTDSSD